MAFTMREVNVRARSQLVAVLAVLVLVLVLASVAHAQFGVTSFDGSLSSPQAGAHADFSASFSLATDALGNPEGQLRDATVTLPAGMVGDPLAIERCSTEVLQKWECSTNSQVGVISLSMTGCRGVSSSLLEPVEAGATTITVPNARAFCSEESNDTITIGEGANAETAVIWSPMTTDTIRLSAPLQHAHAAGEPVSHVAVPSSGSLPLFNVEPSAGDVATFAASVLLADLVVHVKVGDDGRLVAKIDEASTVLPVVGTTMTLWGVPAASSHEPLRCSEIAATDCGLRAPEPAAFMTSPTYCSGAPPELSVSVTSWQGQSASSTAVMPAMTGCSALTLAPSLSVAATTRRRDSPTSYEVDLHVPQSTGPYALAAPALEDMTVTLPKGTSLSPALASGLQTCEPAELARGDCPDASKVGVAEVVSPLLAEPLVGALYMGTPTPSARFPVFMRLVAGSTALDLVGQIELNEQTERLTTVFEDLPPLALEDLKLRFFTGALVNPSTCGPATSNALITSAAGQTVDLSSTFEVSEGSEGGACSAPAPFSPIFTAGTTNPLAGASSPFTLTVGRSEGQQLLSSFTVRLPPGLVGRVKEVTPCPEPAAASGDCPQSSSIGTATIDAGAGPVPLALSGPVYLTGPYAGAPFGLDVVVQAGAGPFDLGSAVMRSRILVDPSDLALTIVSNQLPVALGGISLQLRSVSMELGRPGFMVNAASCAPQTITATIGSGEGAQAQVSTPYRATDCAALRLATQVRASTQGSDREEGGGASLSVVLTSPASTHDTISSLVTDLPRQLRPRLKTLKGACTTTELSACPAGSIIGQAVVSSPALLAPLSGSVYLVARPGGALPTLAMDLRGGEIEVDLQGTLSVSAHDVVAVAFRDLPDVPISAFELTLPRGPHAILGAVTQPCGKHFTLNYALADQSGSKLTGKTPIVVSGCARHAR
jgi:hypothetical protein